MIRKLPNIFDFATSELSQDAVLCYLATWASEEYKASHPDLHQLGQKFIKVVGVLNSTVRTVEVLKQYQNIDVGIKINENEYFLIIEDKTGTAERPDQLQKYRKKIEGGKIEEDKEDVWGPDRVLTCYLKTGNFPKTETISDHKAIVVKRIDLLGIFRSQPFEDQILGQFHEYLEKWEANTQSFHNKLLGGDDHWEWSAQQGFYMWLEEKLKGEGSWHYVSNQQGGFLAYYFNWKDMIDLPCQLYLQIEHAKRLQIRVCNVMENGVHIKAGAPLRWKIYRHIQSLAQNDIFKSLKVEKSGAFQPGMHGGVVDLSIKGSSTFLSQNSSGLDEAKTINSIQEAVELVNLTANSKIKEID